MDFKNLLRSTLQYLSDYGATCILTLSNPEARFRPAPEVNLTPPSASTAGPAANETAKLPPRRAEAFRGPSLNPRLIGYMLLSFLIGSVFNLLVPGRILGVDFLIGLLVSLFLWFIYTLIVYGIYRGLGGRASFAQVFSISLQLAALLYIFSSILALLWGFCTQLPSLQPLRLTWLGPVIAHPIYVYYFFQLTLVATYLSLALGPIRGLDLARSLIWGFVPPLGWSVFSALALAGLMLPTWLVPPAPTVIPRTLTPSPMPTATPTLTLAPTLAPTVILSPTFTPTFLPTPTAMPTRKRPVAIKPRVPTSTPTPTRATCEADPRVATACIINNYSGRWMRFTIGGGNWGTHDYDIPGDSKPFAIPMPPGQYTYTASVIRPIAHGEPFAYLPGQVYTLEFSP